MRQERTCSSPAQPSSTLAPPHGASSDCWRLCDNEAGRMLAKYILGGLAVVFLIAATIRGPRTPQGRTWLLIAAIFGIVSFWLFARG